MEASHQNTRLDKFRTAMQSIYGPFETIPDISLSSWHPPPMAEGHKGRYLWTDGFAVVNFLTLYKQTGHDRYLILARRLIEHVHSILGYTRDGTSRLPGATDEAPLKGGLRIGKTDDDGNDGDGQYFHYLTVWMFALNRMTHITGEAWYNQQAVSMAKGVLPKFMIRWDSKRPRMFWKMSMDLSRPLIMNEGNLDPIQGYVMYRLLQTTAGDPSILKDEIFALKKCIDTKWQDYSSSDALDTGMTLWTAHWLSDEEEWASVLSQRALACLQTLVAGGHFERATAGRLAFREFGTALGAQCFNLKDTALGGLANSICRQWESAGLVPEPTVKQQHGRMAELTPITEVMYATASIPGVMMNRST